MSRLGEMARWGIEMRKSHRKRAGRAHPSCRMFLMRAILLRRVGVIGVEARPHHDALHEHAWRREPPHPGPLLHKCVEEREREGRTRVLGIHGRNSSGNSRPEEGELSAVAPVRSNQIKPNQTCGEGGQG
jgi:hypothetical protein